jgi:hypothetical protein
VRKSTKHAGAAVQQGLSLGLKDLWEAKCVRVTDGLLLDLILPHTPHFPSNQGLIQGITGTVHCASSWITNSCREGPSQLILVPSTLAPPVSTQQCSAVMC